jgi:hypothetical protein
MRAIHYLFGERGTFFGVEHSGTLNLLRFLYCLVTAITIAGYSGEYDRLYRMAPYYPSPLFEMFGDQPMPFAAYQSLRWVCVALLTLAALGFFTRPALVLSALAFFAYEGTQLGFTKPPHSDYSFHITNLTFFFLLILAVAPGVDRHTLLTTLRKQNQPALIPEWPRKAMITMIALAYFGAGYCRVLNDWRWADGYTLQGYLFEKAVRWDLAIGLEIAQHWLPCVVFSVLTMMLELGYPIVIAFPRFKPLLIIGGLMMHLGIYLAMGINFFFFFAYNYFAFLEWPFLCRLFGGAKAGIDRALEKAMPAGPIPRAHIAGFAVFALIQAGSVFGRIEKWPFSDFRVFQKRNHPHDVCVLYFSLPDDPARGIQSLPFWDQYYFERSIGWEPEKKVVAANRSAGAERDEQLESAKRLMLKRLTRDHSDIWRRYPNGFNVFAKRPLYNESTGRYDMLTEYVMALPVPVSSERDGG